MSLIDTDFDESVIGRSLTTVRPPADSGSTGGALSTQRVTLASGAEGARA
ncbi:hypothetical protein [Actinomadura madurae]|nr:hypothetical protein [Actinomadura madurae]MCP9949483.1 hypothetical protein [Actinomadura madurae]MCP9966237.1 hypothetical protein [Actinomadura madurae]MCP9978731.1 hypothetical protein [Actinomadura madurae]MCQ0009751.1 hypothetical protein [Actinomadura madurae]MCQ0014924.1 hypothetical protein [Actinomadura madurae]